MYFKTFQRQGKSYNEVCYGLVQGDSWDSGTSLGRTTGPGHKAEDKGSGGNHTARLFCQENTSKHTKLTTYKRTHQMGNAINWFIQGGLTSFDWDVPLSSFLLLSDKGQRADTKSYSIYWLTADNLY